MKKDGLAIPVRPQIKIQSINYLVRSFDKVLAQMKQNLLQSVPFALIVNMKDIILLKIQNKMLTSFDGPVWPANSLPAFQFLIHFVASLMFSFRHKDSRKLLFRGLINIVHLLRLLH